MTQKMLFTLSLGFGGLILATQAAQSAPQCGLRAVVIAALADTYGETRRGLGLAPNQTVIEVFATDESGSLTITASAPDGQTCLIASGLKYQARSDAPPPKGTPA